MAINALPAIVRAASSITDSTTSSNDQDLTGFRKRSVAASYSSQILFGGSDQNKYTGPIICKFIVVLKFPIAFFFF